ncbi:MAG: hypothetical protein NZ528_09505 [Caldilineales bacterium]|nr:hypothetical protein [Caldilineales bacterium]MDW8318457.1 hypothetical protein [Anaerolineae bacterium]
MTALQTALEAVLRSPEPQHLVSLQEALWLHRAALPPEERSRVDEALAVAGDFYRYLVDLQARLSARQFSELASWLDMAAVGAVALEHVTAGSRAWSELATAALSEALMAVGSRQYVKAWSAELQGVDLRAAWSLRDTLWRVSLAWQPNMDPEARLALVQRLTGPLLDGSLSPAGKLVLLARLYQVLLALQGMRLLAPHEPGE